jgi:Glycosyltransferase sugar-binding region containing DXD motif
MKALPRSLLARWLFRVCYLLVAICYLVITTTFLLDLHSWAASSLDEPEDSSSLPTKKIMVSPPISHSFPKNLESAVRRYEQDLAATAAPKATTTTRGGTIWQTWREPHLSPAVEAKWDRYLDAHPTLERQVVTDLYDVFPRIFGNSDDEGNSKPYFNRTVARLIPGAAQADVWRYATLYHYGGIYVDADSTIVEESALLVSSDNMEHWFAIDQSAGYEHPIPILSHEGHNWRRQYVSRCRGIWTASNMTLPETYDRSVLQWMLIFPLPHHPILWQALHLVDRLIAAAAQWDDDNNDNIDHHRAAFTLADKVLCVTGPAVFTVAVHSVVEAFPQLQVHWEGIDYNGKALFKDPAAPPDKRHYQSRSSDDPTRTAAAQQRLLLRDDTVTNLST